MAQCEINIEQFRKKPKKDLIEISVFQDVSKNMITKSCLFAKMSGPKDLSNFHFLKGVYKAELYSAWE
jgi:hypothetical protein